MPALFKREKPSRLQCLDLGVLRGVWKIIDRFKLIPLKHPLSASLRQSFHPCCCAEPVQFWQKLVLEPSSAALALAAMNQSGERLKGRNLSQLTVALGLPCASGRIPEFERR
jgi:hypothetical protein